jgi:hypothetical protein
LACSRSWRTARRSSNLSPPGSVFMRVPSGISSTPSWLSSPVPAPLTPTRPIYRPLP